MLKPKAVALALMLVAWATQSRAAAANGTSEALVFQVEGLTCPAVEGLG
jgi:hypothetical protein